MELTDEAQKSVARRIALFQAHFDQLLNPDHPLLKLARQIVGRSSKHLALGQRRRRKRRSAIEPKIGHAKSANRMGCCYLKGLFGDAMNALLECVMYFCLDGR